MGLSNIQSISNTLISNNTRLNDTQQLNVFDDDHELNNQYIAQVRTIINNPKLTQNEKEHEIANFIISYESKMELYIGFSENMTPGDFNKVEVLYDLCIKPNPDKFQFRTITSILNRCELHNSYDINTIALAILHTKSPNPNKSSLQFVDRSFNSDLYIDLSELLFFKRANNNLDFHEDFANAAVKLINPNSAINTGIYST